MPQVDPASMQSPGAEVPLRTPTKVDVGRLHFDPENPRLWSHTDPKAASDVEIIQSLSENADLGELMQSIAASGYIDIEPLVVESIGRRLIVLEGNRRLAALRLLSDPELARAAQITVPPLGSNTAGTLDSVLVYRVADRLEARDFIGFKHINGPHRWDSFAKAQFAAKWYSQERDNGTSLRDIARRMGDRHDTIKRMVAGIFVLQQAEAKGLFSLEDRFPGRPFAFSHLYTALTRPGFRQFLGLPLEWRQEDPQPNPVPDENLPNLRQVMLWLYGSTSDNVKPVVLSQNPNVRELAEVLAHPRARAIMLAQSDLRTAYAEVEPPSAQFEKSLVDAHQATEGALSKIGAYDGKDQTLMQLADETKSNAGLIVDIMRAKRVPE
jgi:hypothetical protein